MQLVFGQHDLVADWVSEKIGALIAKPYVAIGAMRDGKLCAGWVFNHWNGHNIEISWASEFLTRGMIRAVHHYVFVQSGAGRVSALTRRSNKTMREMFPRFGFEFEGVQRRYYGPNKADDAFLFVLFPENARKFL
jgi:RimJ/RimL family protein N-acetyltransferase